MSAYATLDDWLNETENYGVRAERIPPGAYTWIAEAWKLGAASTELAQRPAVLEALILAEDVLSRRPFSSEIWPNGMHPQIGIDKIRDAIKLAVTKPDRPCQLHESPYGWDCTKCGGHWEDSAEFRCAVLR